MAISWSTTQRSKIDELIHAHPPEGGQCDQLANGIRPYAVALDAGTHTKTLTPAGGFIRYVLPKGYDGPPWYYHVTTIVSGHAIDSLTGTPGTAWPQYLGLHFDHPETIVVK